MRSLKRSWNGPMHSDREQKRACSDFSPNPSWMGVQGHPDLSAIKHDSPQKAVRSELPKQCLHKTSSCNSLQSLGRCCACADKRPMNSQYLRYVDGVGDTHTGSRWMHYCPECQGIMPTRLYPLFFLTDNIRSLLDVPNEVRNSSR